MECFFFSVLFFFFFSSFLSPKLVMTMYYNIKYPDCSEVHFGTRYLRNENKKPLKAQDIQVGMNVYARWTPNREYYQAIVKAISDDQIILSPEELMPKTSQEIQKEDMVFFLFF